MASIIKHAKGWRASVYVKGQRDTKVFRTKPEATAWAAAREVALRENTGVATPQKHTLREMLERYAAEISPRKKRPAGERQVINKFLCDFPILSGKLVSEISTPDLAAWRDTRLKNEHVSANTILRNATLLQHAFSVAIKEWKWLTANPFVGLYLPPTTPPRSRRISPREVKMICRALGYKSGCVPKTKDQETALIFLIALRTAMRRGEILQLGTDTLDMQRRVATVSHKTQHITGRPREVPLSRHALRLLRPVANCARCFSISYASLDVHFRRVRDQLHLKDLHFHDSRAEALTRLSRKVDVMTLAKISGHSDLRILQNVYYRETAEDIAARL